MGLRVFTAVIGVVAVVSGCSATPKSFYLNPTKPGSTSLCRSYFEAQDPQYRTDVGAELKRRGLTPKECESRIAMETAAIIGIAAVATGVAVAAACSNGCSGPAYQPQLIDYDCKDGTGNGPYYIKGPVWVGADDPYGLDADGDGMGCELSDRLQGA